MVVSPHKFVRSVAKNAFSPVCFECRIGIFVVFPLSSAQNNGRHISTAIFPLSVSASRKPFVARIIAKNGKKLPSIGLKALKICYKVPPVGGKIEENGIFATLPASNVSIPQQLSVKPAPTLSVSASRKPSVARIIAKNGKKLPSVGLKLVKICHEVPPVGGKIEGNGIFATLPASNVNIPPQLSVKPAPTLSVSASRKPSVAQIIAKNGKKLPSVGLKLVKICHEVPHVGGKIEENVKKAHAVETKIVNAKNCAQKPLSTEPVAPQTVMKIEPKVATEPQSAYNNQLNNDNELFYVHDEAKNAPYAPTLSAVEIIKAHTERPTAKHESLNINKEDVNVAKAA